MIRFWLGFVVLMFLLGAVASISFAAVSSWDCGDDGGVVVLSYLNPTHPATGGVPYLQGTLTGAHVVAPLTGFVTDGASVAIPYNNPLVLPCRGAGAFDSHNAVEDGWLRVAVSKSLGFPVESFLMGLGGLLGGGMVAWAFARAGS